jgi:plastocyanin
MASTVTVTIPLRVSGTPHRFEPADISIEVGDTVAWTNEDKDFHTVTSDTPDAFPGGELDGPGATYSHTFDTAGEFPYHCEIHFSMTGTIKVSEPATDPS